jgi:aminoglycoside phosphotransferase
MKSCRLCFGLGKSSRAELALTPSQNRSKMVSGSQSMSPARSDKPELIFRNMAAHKTVVIKGIVGHPRVENERDVLKRLQHRTPFLRPLVDEIEDPATPTTIALRHLNSDLWTENKGTLNRKELKHVCRSVLEALRVLHEENLVHTGM